MSLGFLTESALVPSRATPIRVDAQSLVDLKAVVSQKDQERQQRLREAAAAPATGRGRSKYAHLRGKSRRREGARESNRGVEKRRRRDQEADQLDPGDRDDDAKWERKSKAMLEKKARLYEQMASGRTSAPVASECLVDFQTKRLEAKDHPLPEPDAAERVEIVDEFGRTRLVKSGSPEHLEFLSAQQQKTKTRADSANSSERDAEREFASHGGNKQEPRASGVGSFVVSQWEYRLKAEEKSYLREVHERATLAKAAAQTTGASTMSIEQLRQHREGCMNADESSTTTTQQITSLSEQVESDSTGAAIDAVATAQATNFLNELSSLM